MFHFLKIFTRMKYKHVYYGRIGICRPTLWDTSSTKVQIRRKMHISITLHILYFGVVSFKKRFFFLIITILVIYGVSFSIFFKLYKIRNYPAFFVNLAHWNICPNIKMGNNYLVNNIHVVKC